MTTQMGRLAMRVEGTLWVGYFALPDTMTEAILLGSIQMAFVRHPERKAAFLRMMQECVTDLIKEVASTDDVSWNEDPKPAPEHERAGRTRWAN